jgi:hypothetical protein
MVDYDVVRFLKGIVSPTMVVIIYQGFESKISTVVASLSPICCWAESGHPRLDFDKPANWDHGPDFWGGFILAIAEVRGLEPTEVVDDDEARYFIRAVTLHGVPRELPETICDED